LGSIYFNPATITQFDGIQAHLNSTLIVPDAHLTLQSNSSPAYANYTNFLGGSGSSGNIGLMGAIPSVQMTYRLNSDLWLGLSLAVPFGQATKADPLFVGRVYGSTTRVASAEVEPIIGYKINDRLSVGFGLRYLDFSARYSSAAPSMASPDQWRVLGIDGGGQALGFSLGTVYKPWQGTEIGLGYRSETSVKLNGSFFGGGALAANFGGSAALASATLDQPVQMTLQLPRTYTFGLKQQITADWTALAAFEYVQWSSLKNPQVSYAQSGSSLAASWSAGQSHLALPSIPLYYRDSWFASVGAEYRYSDDMKLRAGLAYEKSPLGMLAQSTRLPDSNRIWASLGLTYQIAPQWSMDLAYLHIFMLGDSLKIDPNSATYSQSLGAAGLGTLNAKVNNRVEIVSLGLTYKFDTK
jgi:long-chain fatty acid transport protein